MISMKWWICRLGGLNFLHFDLFFFCHLHAADSDLPQSNTAELPNQCRQNALRDHRAPHPVHKCLQKCTRVQGFSLFCHSFWKCLCQVKTVGGSLCVYARTCGCLHSLESFGCLGRLASIRDSGLRGRFSCSPRSRSRAGASSRFAATAMTRKAARSASRNAGLREGMPNLRPPPPPPRYWGRRLSALMPLLKVTATVRIAEEVICDVG